MTFKNTATIYEVMKKERDATRQTLAEVRRNLERLKQTATEPEYDEEFTAACKRVLDLENHLDDVREAIHEIETTDILREGGKA